MFNLKYKSVSELEGIYPGAKVRCLEASSSMGGSYRKGGIYSVDEDLMIIGDDGGRWQGDSGSWEIVNETSLKETAKMSDNPFVQTVTRIVDLDANLPEFDYITVELGPHSIDWEGVKRLYLRIGGNGSFENISKKGLGNLIKALAEVHDLMVDE